MNWCHQTTAFQKPLFLHDSSSLRSSSSLCSERITNGYADSFVAPGQPKFATQTSHTRQPLNTIFCYLYGAGAVNIFNAIAFLNRIKTERKTITS